MASWRSFTGPRSAGDGATEHRTALPQRELMVTSSIFRSKIIDRASAIA